MNAVKHILMTVCTGIVLWLMTLVGGLAWAMFSTPGSRQRTALGSRLLRDKPLQERGSDAIRIGEHAIGPAVAARLPCGVRCNQSDREGLYQRPCSSVQAEANHPLTGTRRLHFLLLCSFR